MNFILNLLFLIIIGGTISCTRNNFSAVQNEASEAEAPDASGLPIQIKAPFPELELKSDAGNMIKTSALKGKTVIINFWATWCQPCLRELPELQKLYTDLNSKGLEILAINLDQNPEKSVQLFKTKLNLTFPIFVDPENVLLDTLKIQAIPFNVVIDKRGIVRKIEPGFEDWSSKQNRDFIETLLNEETK